MTSISKIFVFIVCGFFLCLTLSACLGGESAETVVTNWQNATIKSFSMADNKEVCPKLSGYKFTIDNFGTSDPELSAKMPGSGIIFNPDSLPVGTVADSIKVEIECTNVSSVLINQFDDAGTLKKTTNYKDTQLVYFDDFAVTRIDVVSYDGSTKKSYFVKVNTHKVYGDTIRWQYRAKDVFETADVVNQRVDTLGKTLLWYAEYSDGTVKACLSDLAGDVSVWSPQITINADEMLDVNAIFNWNNILYAVGKNGSLLMSADGVNWDAKATDNIFVNILGLQYGTKHYAEHLHAIVVDGGEYKFARTFDGNTWEVLDVLPEGFPIKLYSRPICDKAKPSAGNVTSRLYIVGGQTADGSVISSTWSCDGNSWAEFKQGFLPAMTSPAIVQYTLNADSPKSFWILWPGIFADGSVANNPYFSENRGVTWKKMKTEFYSYSTTSPISPVGGVSAFMNNDNYWMYFFGGVAADGSQQANVFGGQLMKLTFDKIK